MITVVIASHGYGHLAGAAIESVLGQRRKADRIIFVDDGVGDCERLPALYPEVKFVLRPVNMGVVDNFQDILMNHIETERALFLGADNWLHPKCLEYVADKGGDIISYDLYVVGTGAQQFADKTNASRDETGFIRWRGVRHGSSAYNVELARKVGGYRRGNGVHTEEDTTMFNAMIAAGAQTPHVPVGLMYYLRHRSNHNTP